MFTRYPALSVLIALLIGIAISVFAASTLSRAKQIEVKAETEKTAQRTKLALETVEVDKLVTLAKECHARGDCDDAVQLLERSVTLSTKVFGADSKETKQRMKDLAVMYLTLGREKDGYSLMSKLKEKPAH